MTNNTRKKQILIVAVLVILGVFLFTRDIKGLVKENNESPETIAASTTSPASDFSIEDASTIGKNMISSSLSKEITALEADYKRTTGAEQLDKARQLARKWDDVGQPAPSAMYLEVVAEKESALANWLAAGNMFQKAFDEAAQDEAVQPAMLKKANVAFNKALEIDSASLDARSGLGITMVNGMGAPMAGIKMLQEVVEKDPKNLKANMNLGLFALKSGQFDKAVTRFTGIIQTIKATPDAYFYLATAYEGLGKNGEAIDAYLNSKKLAANPTLSKFIDQKIEELRKK